MLQFILRPQWAVESMGWVLQVETSAHCQRGHGGLHVLGPGSVGLPAGSWLWGSSPVGCAGPQSCLQCARCDLGKGSALRGAANSAAPFRQICSSELFIASQISSPICLSAYENASLWCTCYISLLLSKIKSQHTLPTSLFICICFWWSASPIRRRTDALDVLIAPCHSFQVPNNEINFVNDKCKGNMQQTEWPHWVAFQADVCWICDADAVFHEQLNFPWLHPPEKDK